MSIRCRGCGQINEDGKPFCSACGDPLDADMRLLMELENRNKNKGPHPLDRKSADEDDYVAPVRRETKKKGSGKLWVSLLVFAALVAVWMFTR